MYQSVMLSFIKSTDMVWREQKAQIFVLHSNKTTFMPGKIK